MLKQEDKKVATFHIIHIDDTYAIDDRLHYEPHFNVIKLFIIIIIK